MLLGNLGSGEMKVVVDHLECGVAEYLPQGKYVTTIHEIVYGKTVPA
jgi:hypothetical protein